MAETISVEVLERLARKRRFSARTLEIAKRLFIYGTEPKRLAIEYGVDPQRISAIRNQVEKAAEESRLPPGLGGSDHRGPEGVDSGAAPAARRGTPSPMRRKTSGHDRETVCRQ